MTRSAAELETWCASHTHAIAALPEGEYPVAYSARVCRLAEFELPELPSLAALASWWRDNQQQLQHLVPDDLAKVVEAKDRAKARLEPTRGMPPPAVVLPSGRAGTPSSRLI